LDLLTEAKVQRRFRASDRSLPHLYAGYYVAELLASLTDLGDPHPDLYNLAQDTIWRLDDMQNPATVIARFELNALRFLGLLPTLDNCSSCGLKVSENRRIPFGQITGGILCQSCRRGQAQVVSVSWPVIVVMRQLAAADVDVSTDLPEISKTVNGELRGLMNNYMSHLLGKAPRMIPFLGMLVQPSVCS
jgi:DNA repair protein RecO (recombination protein O)